MMKGLSFMDVVQWPSKIGHQGRHASAILRASEFVATSGHCLSGPESDDPSMGPGSPPVLDPWRLVWGQPYIDSRTLAAAIEQDLQRDGARFPHPAPGPRRGGRHAILLGGPEILAMAGGEPGRRSHPSDPGGRPRGDGIPGNTEETRGQYRLDPTPPDLRPARAWDSRPAGGPYRRLDSHAHQRVDGPSHR